MIEGLELEIWGQRARRVKAVLVTADNRNAILLWLGFTQDEIDTGLGGIVADLDVGDGVVITGNGVNEDGSPKVGNFTRVAADQIDHLYRRNVGGVDNVRWYAFLDDIDAGDNHEAPTNPVLDEGLPNPFEA